MYTKPHKQRKGVTGIGNGKIIKLSYYFAIYFKCYPQDTKLFIMYVIISSYSISLLI